MTIQSYRRTKLSCYSANISMSVIGNLPPLLFITFREMYGISYSLLGTLIVISFAVQMVIDLVFSFFSHKFNIAKTVKIIPVITFFGMLIYALAPILFPNNVYIGLVIGTLIFSSSGGLVEVLISPVIAAIPSKDPDREMSKLHSVYAWGVVPVILLSTAFLAVFGGKYWQILVLLFMLVPLFSAFLFFGANIPKMETPEKVTGALRYLKDKGVWLCVIAIFLGGATECTMAQWASGYIEKALQIPKLYGDVFGVTMFSLMLGIGRSLYAKYGRSTVKVLLACSAGAFFCYLTAALSPIPIIGLIACAITGLCVSMLWPGSLIVASDRYPQSGVFIFAMMAAGGDTGASVAPQLVGIIADTVMANPYFAELSTKLGLLPEQIGMKAGMLIGAIFPLLAVLVYARFLRQAKK